MSWRTRNDSDDSPRDTQAIWSNEEQKFESNLQWMKPIITLRNKEAQIKLELIRQNQEGEWLTVGEPYISEWLPPSSWHYMWPFITLLLSSEFLSLVFQQSESIEKREQPFDQATAASSD